MEINGKEYKITADIELGILEDFQENATNKNVKELVKAVLIPQPTDSEYRKFKQSDVMNIILAFYKEQSSLSTEFKKKLSVL